MNALHITGAGCVEREAFTGGAGFSASWRALGLDPLRDRIRWPAVFPRAFPEFRQLDRLTRIVCIAGECAGLTPAHPEAENTALVSVSAEGCLASDHEFERSLARGEGTQSGLFPFTLTSTALGALAIRHGLRGPTLALSTPAGREARALRDAADLVTSGEAARLVLCLGDWVGAETAAALGLEERAEVVVLVLEAGDPGRPRAGFPSLEALLATRDPVSSLAHHVRLAFPVASSLR